MTNANSNAKSAILMVVGFSLVTAVADTYHWTGGAGKNTDGVYQWTVAENWQENAVPGQSETSDDEVIFGAMEGNPASVTIDLTGEVAVRNVTFVDAAAPAYKLGTSRGTSDSEDNGQSMRLRTGGVVSISSEVVNDQTILRLAPESASSNTLILSNVSSQAALAIDTIGRWLAFGQKDVMCQYTLAGTGRILLFDYIWTGSKQPPFTFKGSLSVVWRNDGKRLPRSVTFAADWTGTFEIAEGAVLNATLGTSPFNNALQFASDTTIDGPGAIQALKMLNSDNIDNGNTPLRSLLLNVTAKKTVTVNVPLKPASGYEGWIPLYSANGGTIRLNGANSLVRGIVIHGNVNVEAQKFGLKDCEASETSIGLMDEIVFQPYFNYKAAEQFTCTTRLNATLAYSGDADTTCDRDFRIQNGYYDYEKGQSDYFCTSQADIDCDSCCATATVATVGSGALTLTGHVNTWADGAVFGLDARTAPIVFSGVFPTSTKIGLSVRGQETVTLDGANVSDLNGLEISSCALKITGSGSGFTINGPVRIRGKNTVEVKPGASLYMYWNKLTMDEGATVNFDVPDDSSVTFGGATSATAVPEGITVNNAAVRFDNDGKLVPFESHWKSAVDGEWSEGSMWSAGVPQASDTANIIAGGADYTVTMDEAPAAMPEKIIVGQGETGYTSTLALTDGFTGLTMPLEVKMGGLLRFCGEGQFDLTAMSVDLSAGGAFLASDSANVTVCDANKKGELGTGYWRFAGDSCLTQSVDGSTLTVKPDKAGETATLELDNSTVPTAGRHSFTKGSIYLGGQTGGSTKLIVMGKDDTNKATNFIFASQNPWRIGISQNGYGEIDMRGGYLRTGNNGLWIGSSEKASTALAVTGVVNQTGGYVYQTASGATASAYFNGLKIGCGEYCVWSKVSSDDISCSGTYNLMGGQLLSTPGYTVIGAGSGVGRFVQTGGTFSHDSSANSNSYTNHLTGTVNFQYPMIIGLVGGSGLYVLSNGTAKVTKDLYIGGAQTNEMPWATTVGIDPAIYPEENYDARGVLSVQGGTFTCSSNVFVGVAGSGTIELGGTGSLTVKDNALVLSNATESVLKFGLPEAGFASAPLKVTGAGRLVLTSGSKLVVDVRGYNGAQGGRKQKLAELAAVDGAFGDFEVVCDESERSYYTDSTYEIKDGALWFRLPRKGTILIVQ